MSEEIVEKKEEVVKVTNHGYRRAIPFTFEFNKNDVPLGYLELFDESRIKDMNWDNYKLAAGVYKNPDGTWVLMEISIVEKKNKELKEKTDEPVNS